MSGGDRFVQAVNYKYVFHGLLAALMLISASSGRADPTASQEPSMMPSAFGYDGRIPTMNELREHAATINDILETASERVELLAATDADTPALVEAIRQELSLSRRWNRHLGTILLDVAEARRALGKRERDAAKEIMRLTAVAEEARLELVALKEVLKDRPDDAVQSQKTWPEGRLNEHETGMGTDSRMASNASIMDALREGSAGFEAGTVKDARAMLASIQAAETSLVRDVDAVRGKIIEALQTLATVSGDLPTRMHDADAALSSEDITAWAASMATRLNRVSEDKTD